MEVFLIVLVGLAAVMITVYLTYLAIKYFDPTCDILEGDITDRW